MAFVSFLCYIHYVFYYHFIIHIYIRIYEIFGTFLERTHREIIFNATSNSSWILRHIYFSCFAFATPRDPNFWFSFSLFCPISLYGTHSTRILSFLFLLFTSWTQLLHHKFSIFKVLMSETNFHFTLLQWHFLPFHFSRISSSSSTWFNFFTCYFYFCCMDVQLTEIPHTILSSSTK